MLKKVALALVALVVVLAIVIATRPDTYQVVRQGTIAAPPQLVYAQLSDFHHWVEWSPWDKRDPTMKKTFAGAAAATGAVYSWQGNDQVGEGKMEITDVKPNEQVTIKLDFLKPFPSTSTTVFGLTADGSNTKVSWTMNGNRDFMAKAFSLVMDMDKMVGPDFEQGLANLKGVSEHEAQKMAAAAPAPTPAPAGTPAAAPAAPAAGKPNR